jgi:hypothetical protein
MRGGIITSSIASKSANRTANTGRATFEDMGIDHRRSDLVVALLGCPNIIAAFQKMARL